MSAAALPRRRTQASQVANRTFTSRVGLGPSMIRVRAPKEFWSGLLFLAIGAAGVWLARDYPYGSALRMGPGYLPTLLSWCTAILGGIVFGRSFMIAGPDLHGFKWRPLLMVLLAIAVFGLLINRAGLVLTVIATAIVGGLASRELGRLELVALSLALAIFCALVFVIGLGQPMELWPDWLADRLREWRR